MRDKDVFNTNRKTDKIKIEKLPELDRLEPDEKKFLNSKKEGMEKLRKWSEKELEKERKEKDLKRSN